MSNTYPIKIVDMEYSTSESKPTAERIDSKGTGLDR